MPLVSNFEFEPAPDLPGADTLSKYGLALIRRAVGSLWDVTIEGNENVPRTGPGIITPNHLSFSDSIFVPAALPRRIWAIGKGEYLDDWKTKHLFPAMGMIPVDRSGGDAAQVALDTAAKVLRGGHLFMIYPEGTRSRSGNLHKGRTGAARLAARTGAPIIPVGHTGTLAIQPPDSVMLKVNKPCTIRFGKPMRVEDFGDPADPRILRVMTDAVMFEISKLSGQTYVDTYAGDVATTEPAGSEAQRPASAGGATKPSRPKNPPTAPAVPTRRLPVPAGRQLAVATAGNGGPHDAGTVLKQSG